MKNGDEEAVSDDDVEEFSAMLELLDDAIEEAHQKIESGRVYDAENEKVRIKWIHALSRAMNVRRQIVKERELEEVNERLDQIEEMLE